MYSSPGTPGATGRRAASSTYTRVLAIGRPIVTRSEVVTSAAVDQIVVSVGPYRFVTERAVAASVTARSDGSDSPPTSTRRPDRSTPASTSACHRLGVACITVAPDAFSRAPRTDGSPTASRSARIRPAPFSRGRYISRPAMSNPTVVTAGSRSSAESWKRSCIEPRKLANAPSGITTPLGRPVDPEV